MKRILIIAFVFLILGCSLTIVRVDIGEHAKTGNIEVKMDTETKTKLRDNQSTLGL